MLIESHIGQVISFAPDATPPPAPTPTILPFTGAGSSTRRVDALQRIMALFTFALCVMLAY